MPDDGPRHFELENTLEDSDDCAKQPAQLAVLALAAGSRRPTRRRPLGSISRDSLLWTAHELAAQRHGRLGWSTSPPGEYRRAPSFNRLSVPRSGAERRFYSRGGRHRRAAHWAVLSCLDVAHRKPTSKNRSHTREERKTRTAYAIQQKIAHVGLSAPHDGAQLKNADSGGLGSTRERRQGRRFGPRFKWLRRRHQNQLMGNSSSSAPFQKRSGLLSTQWMWVSTTSTSSSRRP